jgi:hypothetical protein
MPKSQQQEAELLRGLEPSSCVANIHARHVSVCFDGIPSTLHMGYGLASESTARRKPANFLDMPVL